MDKTQYWLNYRAATRAKLDLDKVAVKATEGGAPDIVLIEIRKAADAVQRYADATHAEWLS